MFLWVNKKVLLLYAILQVKVEHDSIVSADWVATSAHDPLPANPIFVGTEADGSAVYVGR